MSYKSNILKNFLFNFFEKFGYHLIKSNFYSVIPSRSEIDHYLLNNKNNGLEILLKDYNFENINEILNFASNKKAIFENIHEFNKENGYFENLDAIFYELIIRKNKPKNIIEIGAGFSTLISEKINETKSYNLTIIEPYPRDFLKKLKNINLLEKKLQDIDFKIFDKLGENDILFIDSSHSYKIGSDVYYIFNSILPRLKKGVFVHFHDIFLPNDYPMTWIKDSKIFWNEQYFLNSFLMFNPFYQIIYPLNFLYKSNLVNFMKLTNFYPYSYKNDIIGPGSFWIKKND